MIPVGRLVRTAVGIPLAATGATIGAAVAVTKLVSPRPLALAVRPRMRRHEHTHPEIDALQQRVEVTRDLRVSGEGHPDVTYDVYRPKGQRGPLPVLIWWHGGGFIGGDKGGACCLAHAVADRGYVVVSGEYAFAPEHRYPVAIEQAVTLVQHVLRSADELRIDPSRVALGGDSAGCGIAAQILGMETNDELAERMGMEPVLEPEQLRAAILYCGPHDMDTIGESGFPYLNSILWAYTGKKHWRDFNRLDELSSSRWVTPEWPPCLISAGDADELREQSYALARSLGAQGVSMTTVFHDGSDKGLRHAYELGYDTAEGLEVLRRTLDFLDTHTA